MTHPLIASTRCPSLHRIGSVFEGGIPPAQRRVPSPSRLQNVDASQRPTGQQFEDGSGSRTEEVVATVAQERATAATVWVATVTCGDRNVLKLYLDLAARKMCRNKNVQSIVSTHTHTVSTKKL